MPINVFADWMTFVTILLLTFALFLVITGAFTAYFGSGKSRKIGAGLLGGGIVIGLLWILAAGPPGNMFPGFIAIAGLSAALPGTIAAHTTRPVIGVPVSGKVNLDSILSITQMPPGVPVAAVGLDRGENAALLAVQILALTDEGLAKKLREHREAMKRWVHEDNKSLGE